MLGTLLRTLFGSRPTPPATGHAPAEHQDEFAQPFEAAAEDWRAGRIQEAIAGCKALLERAPGYTPAHSLLATIALPGENYFLVLERIHAHLKPRTYLEIGVAQGTSMRMVGPGTRAIGVDLEPRIGFALPPNVSIFAQASDDFFAERDVRAELDGLPIDLAFIDGMHHFEFALRDFMNIEALCTPASTILMHDVYPLDERTAARERVTNFWSGDIWRLILLLRKHRPDLELHTIAAAPTGLAIVRNLDPQSGYIREHLDELVEEYLALDYGYLGGRKAERLALFPNDWPKIRALLDAQAASGG